jgi:hypothetical protein
MKKIVLAALAATLLIACGETDKKTSLEQKEQMLKDSANFTSIEWLDSTFVDMGKVKQGQVVEVAFRFRNSGTKNLVIESVTPGCGCTVADTPKEPFAPGQEGVIKANFDSKNQTVGPHRKHVTVKANTLPENTQDLDFQVEVTE